MDDALFDIKVKVKNNQANKWKAEEEKMKKRL